MSKKIFKQRTKKDLLVDTDELAQKGNSIVSEAAKIAADIYLSASRKPKRDADFEWLTYEEMEKYRHLVVSERSGRALEEFLSAIDYPSPWPSIHNIEDIVLKNKKIEIIFFNDYNQPEEPSRPIFIPSSSPGHRIQQLKHEESRPIADVSGSIHLGPSSEFESELTNLEREFFLNDFNVTTNAYTNSDTWRWSVPDSNSAQQIPPEGFNPIHGEVSLPPEGDNSQQQSGLRSPPI